MKPTSFYLVTDTHYFENSLGVGGKAYDEYMTREQMCLAENSAIVHATFNRIIEDIDTEIVIIPGDLVKNGEKESHKSFIKELERLKNAGKRVYVITARHDFNEYATAFDGDKRKPVEGTRREELCEMYNEYGFGDAIAFDAESMSYVAEISDGVRMLALNCDGKTDGTGKGSFDERLMSWIAAQTDAAQKDNCFMFAINHYPIIPPAPIFDLVRDARMNDWRRISSFFADNGVPIAFTGHMHIQSINSITSDSGNKFFDVCTSALVGSPAMYRRIMLKNDNEISVESFHIPDFDWDMQGLTCKQYMDRQFDGMIGTILSSMKDDYESFLRRIGTKPKKILKIPVTTMGKIINGITFGGIGRLLFFKPDKTIKKRLVKDFAIEVVRNMFEGDAPYTEGTPEYIAVEKFLKRLGFVISKLEKKLSGKIENIDLNEMVLNTIGNNKGISDNDAIIILK